jgi:hypothetical protein
VPTRLHAWLLLSCRPACLPALRVCACVCAHSRACVPACVHTVACACLPAAWAWLLCGSSACTCMCVHTHLLLADPRRGRCVALQRHCARRRCAAEALMLMSDMRVCFGNWCMHAGGLRARSRCPGCTQLRGNGGGAGAGLGPWPWLQPAMPACVQAVMRPCWCSDGQAYALLHAHRPHAARLAWRGVA